MAGDGRPLHAQMSRPGTMITSEIPIRFVFVMTDVSPRSAPVMVAALSPETVTHAESAQPLGLRQCVDERTAV